MTMTDRLNWANFMQAGKIINEWYHNKSILIFEEIFCVEIEKNNWYHKKSKSYWLFTYLLIHIDEA